MMRHTQKRVSTIELVQHESHRQSGCEESINVMQMFIVIGMFYALHRNKNKIFEWKKCELRKNKVCAMKESFIAHSKSHVN